MTKQELRDLQKRNKAEGDRIAKRFAELAPKIKKICAEFTAAWTKQNLRRAWTKRPNGRF